MGEIVVLGEPRVMQLRFSEIPDEKIEIGQWVIIYNEIPARKIGKELFEVYKDVEPIQIKTWEEEMREQADRIRTMFRELTPSDKYLLDDIRLDDTPKFIKKGHGSKRLRPWESPRYFG